MAIIRPSVISINKPVGITSRAVLNHLQRTYNYKKFGHAGTLDPLASGVLIVLVGDECKKQDYFMLLKKVYKTRIFFCVTSPTYDLEGPYSFAKQIKLSEEDLRIKVEEYLNSILGKFEQVVPLYSSKKIEGRELYDYARKGKKIESLPAKEVELLEFSIELCKVKPSTKDLAEYPPLDLRSDNVVQEYKNRLEYFNKNFSYVDLTLKTGKGFYVRSLAHDLGEYLGCGAVMGSLKRYSVGEYNIENSKKLKDFELAPDLA